MSMFQVWKEFNWLIMSSLMNLSKIKMEKLLAPNYKILSMMSNLKLNVRLLLIVREFMLTLLDNKDHPKLSIKEFKALEVLT